MQGKEYAELLEACTDLDLRLTNENCEAIVNATTGQANSKLWFQQRAGRITASNLKSVYASSGTSTHSIKKFAIRNLLDFLQLLQGNFCRLVLSTTWFDA